MVALTPDCMPKALDGCPHYTDIALIPMQMITAAYVEAAMPADIPSKLRALYAPHFYKPLSVFPPHDQKPREYTYWLEEGLSIGGVSFDEDQVGGPKGDIEQFNPAVIQWDAGKTGAGCGWMSVSTAHFPR